MGIHFNTSSGLKDLTEENFQRFVSCPASLEEVLKCTGIIEIYPLGTLQSNPACVVVLRKYLGALRIDIKTPMVEMTRRLNFRTHAINNDGLRVVKTGNNTGLYIFSGQRRAAISLGFRIIHCEADGCYAEIKDANGYYTWLRFGFELDAEGLENYYEMMWRNFGILRQDAPIPNQLVAMEEFCFTPKGQITEQKLTGRKFWKLYGFKFTGKFHLVNGSVSNKAFIAYVDQGLKDALIQRKRFDIIKKFIELKLRVAMMTNHTKIVRYREQLIIVERQLRLLVKKIEYLMDITQ